MKKVMLVVIPLSLGLLLPTGLPGSALERLSFHADYGYENWQADFQAASIVTHTEDGLSEYKYTEEDVGWNNANYNFYDHAYNFGLGIGLRVIKGLNLNAGAGLCFSRIETYDVDYPYTSLDETALDQLFNTHEPGFYLSGGLDYSLPVYKRLSVRASPGIRFTPTQNLHISDPDKDGAVPEEYTLHQDVFSWNFGLVADLDLGGIVPFVGGRYQGFRQHVDYDETDYSSGEEVVYDREAFLKPSFDFAGLAGIRIALGAQNSLALEAALGKGFSLSTNFQIGW